MFETIWLVLVRFIILIAAFSALFAWSAWLRSTELLKANRIAARRRNSPITIRILANVEGERETLDLPYKPRRDQFSRGELAGVLGLYFGKDRFEPNMLRPILENGRLNQVLEGKLDDSSSDELLELEVSSSNFQFLQQRLASPQTQPREIHAALAAR